MNNAENEIHQLQVAKSLSKGRVTDKCVGIRTIDNIDTIVSVCPLLNLKDGCTKPLIIVNETVSCPVGRGPLRFQSELIADLAVNIPGETEEIAA